MTKQELLGWEWGVNVIKDGLVAIHKIYGTLSIARHMPISKIQSEPLIPSPHPHTAKNWLVACIRKQSNSERFTEMRGGEEKKASIS